jgi:nicotinamide-nucleotide amidase
MYSAELIEKADSLLAVCRAKGLHIAVAESCTGGLLAGVLTEIAGSSDVVDRGFVTYSNAAKRDLLGVPGDLIADYGAVSEQVAIAMAEGVLNHAPVELSASVTGVAGPGGGSPLKPVGHVQFASARRGYPTAHQIHSFGDLSRSEIRLHAVAVALDMMLTQAKQA